MTTLRDARASFFTSAGFDEGTYEDAWVRLPIGPFHVSFPNTAGRKRAVKVHDLHHVLTGYDTSWRGEFAISAWEVGSGCGSYAAAWVLDLGGLFAGSLLFPQTTLLAFVRGTRSKNLYADARWQERLDDDVELVRARLAIGEPPRVALADRARFVAWSAVGGALWLSPLVLLAVVAGALW